MKGKFKHLLASALLVLPLALQVISGAGATVHADGTTTDTNNDTNAYIAIHKLGFSDGSKISTIDNGGDKLATLPDGATLLNGVEFTAYDVTTAYDALDDKLSTTDKRGAISADATTLGTSDNQVGDAQVTNGTGDDAGTANFTLPVKSKDTDKYAVYLLMETKSSTTDTNSNTTVVKAAAPIVLVMPLEKSSSSADPLNLYPKNQTETSVTKDISGITDVLGEATNSKDSGNAVLSLGNTVTYTVNIVVPSDIASLSDYKLTDTPDAGLNYVSGTLKLSDKDGNVITTGDESPDEGGTGFKLDFTGRTTDLKDYAGQTLTLTYDMTFNKDLIPGKTLNNHIQLNNQPIIDSNTPVTTGGAKFVKQDADDATKTLPGAEFIITNGTNKYLTKTGTDGTTATYAWATLPEDFKVGSEYAGTLPDAVKLTSDDEGAFEITGLAFGKYNLDEIKAPAGYTVLGAPQEFEVSATSYNGDNAVQAVKDTPHGILPSTGGMGIYIVIAAGLALVALGFMFLRRGKHHEEA